MDSVGALVCASSSGVAGSMIGTGGPEVSDTTAEIAVFIMSSDVLLSSVAVEVFPSSLKLKKKNLEAERIFSECLFIQYKIQ